FCATHVDAPPALLENRTKQAGNFLSIRLVGVSGERDATGTWIELTAAGRSWRRQLTAGDGFAVRNQSIVTFGLSDAQQVDRLVVRWRGGHTDVFTALPVNVVLTLVEGGRMIARSPPNMGGWSR
ncbi:MAG: hypothetical protein RLY70_3008, partial [Planctomycetota bacterium]